MNILSFENNLINLNSGILEENFGKMSYSSIITEEGILVEVEKKGDEYSFSYSSWTFNEVQSIDTESGRKVFYCGNSPFRSSKIETLLNLLETEKSFESGTALIRILTDAAYNNRNLTYTGAGGIILNLESSEKYQVLFLPEMLFSSAVAGLGDEEKARQIFLWQNPTLHGNTALRFARSLLAYRILTSRVPYPATDMIERNADILDHKFLPIDLYLEKLNSELSEKINSELQLNIATVNRPGKKQKKTIAQKVKENTLSNETDKQKIERASLEYQKAMSVFPMDLLLQSESISKEKISDEDFSKKASDYMTRKAASVKTKRVIRRNVSKILTISIVSIVVILLTINVVKSSGDNGTSKSLTAEETTTLFFQGVNNLDTVLVDDLTKGKTAASYSNMVSQIYVISKNRQAYSQDRGFLNPGRFFLFIKEEQDVAEAGIYGITNLSVNGNEKSLNMKVPLIKERPEPITEDSGIKVYKNMNSVKVAEYYVIHSEANDLYCEKHRDTITLTFLKNRWIITDIESEQVSIPINTSIFYSEYFTALEMTDSPETAVRVMKQKYPWLPDTIDLTTAQIMIDNENAEFRKMFGTQP